MISGLLTYVNGKEYRKGIDKLKIVCWKHCHNETYYLFQAITVLYLPMARQAQESPTLWLVMEQIGELLVWSKHTINTDLQEGAGITGCLSDYILISLVFFLLNSQLILDGIRAKRVWEKRPLLPFPCQVPSKALGPCLYVFVIM